MKPPKLSSIFEGAARLASTTIGLVATGAAVYASYQMAATAGTPVTGAGLAIPATFASIGIPYLAVGIAPRQTMAFLSNLKMPA